MNSTVKISLCQFKVGSNKIDNINKAREYIINACNNGSNIVVLPECFICPYNTKNFKENAEKIFNPNDESCKALKMLVEVSRINPNIYIFGGSIIEEDKDGLLYNTCLVLYDGKVEGIYRKNNLYKINILEHNFSEGDVLTPGNQPTIIRTKYGNIGIGICYDLRFPELAKNYMLKDCGLIIYPGSFNRITGPKHWKLLQQVRALDNQLFVASCSAACSFGSDYESYGKSYLISPWGDTICETELDKEQIVTEYINWNIMSDTRRDLPILKN